MLCRWALYSTIAESRISFRERGVQWEKWWKKMSKNDWQKGKLRILKKKSVFERNGIFWCEIEILIEKFSNIYWMEKKIVILSKNVGLLNMREFLHKRGFNWVIIFLYKRSDIYFWGFYDMILFNILGLKICTCGN